MRLKAVLGFSQLNIPEKIERARFIVNKMTGNPNFTTPTPTLAIIIVLINALELAYSNALSGGPIQTALLYQAEEALDRAMNYLTGYVEYTANGNDAIILSSGLYVKKNGGSEVYILDAKNGENSGAVILTCPAAKGAAYIWQINESPLDADESGWTNLKLANTAKITVDGFIPGKKCWFRVAMIVKNVQGDWSDPISIIVQ